MLTIYQRLQDDFKNLYLGNAILGIIVSSCLGSIAAMLILIQGRSVGTIIHLSWIVIICMVYNAAVLTNQRSKWVFNLQLISVVSSLLTIFYHIFF